MSDDELITKHKRLDHLLEETIAVQAAAVLLLRGLQQQRWGIHPDADGSDAGHS